MHMRSILMLRNICKHNELSRASVHMYARAHPRTTHTFNTNGRDTVPGSARDRELRRSPAVLCLLFFTVPACCARQRHVCTHTHTHP